jgi:UDP-hydrolysing UDP-N-acetyl-D-glucosamine 2-epimerase
MRTIGVVTVARSDYGIYRPVLRRLAEARDLEPALFVGGMHLLERFGLTVREVEADGYPVADHVDFLDDDDSPAAVARALGRGTEAFARSFERARPDILLVLGDRYEMLAAATATLPLSLPLAHIHGGESSEGAFDESIRHVLTKLSHLHFAATEAAARRLRQLGEEPWRIVVSGAPALDEIARLEPLLDAELERAIGLPLDPSPLVVTYHPATRDPRDPGALVRELLAAVERTALPAVFTYPNADPGGAEIRRAIDDYVSRHDDATAVASLGARAYHSLLRRAAAMVGNSSSGIIEAASFGLPVVNVGVRQNGRLRPANVIDVEDDREAIRAAIERAVSPELRASLAALESPYGDGRAAERIVATLTSVELGPRLLTKRFHDLDG